MKTTYLRFERDYLEDAKRYRSKRDAIYAYLECARSLAHFGQAIEASLHYAESANELQEYPNFVLSLGSRGGIRIERA